MQPHLTHQPLYPFVVDHDALLLERDCDAAYPIEGVLGIDVVNVLTKRGFVVWYFSLVVKDAAAEAENVSLLPQRQPNTTTFFYQGAAFINAQALVQLFF